MLYTHCELDAETGYYHNRARHYAPVLHAGDQAMHLQRGDQPIRDGSVHFQFSCQLRNADAPRVGGDDGQRLQAPVQGLKGVGLDGD